MTIPYISDRIAQFKYERERARRKRIAILALCGVGVLAFFAGSIIAGIALCKSREERAALRGERRKCVRDKVQSALDFSDDSPAAAYYDSEKGEFVKKEGKA